VAEARAGRVVAFEPKRDTYAERFARLDVADRQRLPLKPVYFLAPRN
jgi:hypothetical protein